MSTPRMNSRISILNLSRTAHANNRMQYWHYELEDDAVLACTVLWRLMRHMHRAQRCRRVAAALEAGVVWINCSQPCFCQAPWGGVKNSGFGRELGEMGLEAYLSPKQITTYVSKTRWDWFGPSKL